MSIYDNLPVAASRPRWQVQKCTPRDQFETCTLTIEQWLANEDDDGLRLKTKAQKWQALMEAAALALPGVDSQDGLRQEPRVGYDPARDQPFFVFKASNNGTTFLVSLLGLEMYPGDVFEGDETVEAPESRERSLAFRQTRSRSGKIPLPFLSERSKEEQALAYARHDAGLVRLHAGDRLTEEDQIALRWLLLRLSTEDLRKRS